MRNDYKSVDEMYQEGVKSVIRYIHKFSIPAVILSFLIYFQNQGTGINTGAGFWSVALTLSIITFILTTLAVIRIQKVEEVNQKLFEEQEEKRKENIRINQNNRCN